MQKLAWTSVNALGLGLGFLALLETTMLLEFGFDWGKHWVWVEEPVGQDESAAAAYVGTLAAYLIGGVILGASQALVLRTRGVSAVSWILATVSGFGVLAITIDWPLIALDLLGIIPGPVEPIIATVGTGIFAGIFQYLALRRWNVHAAKWLSLLVVGLIVSLVPIVILFISLEALNVSISWPMEVFINGLIVGGVASLVSGQALFKTLSGLQPQT